MKLKLCAITPDGPLVTVTIRSVQFGHYYGNPIATITCADGDILSVPVSWIVAIRMVEE